MKNTIKVERAKMNITQQNLANLVGVTRQTINAIETQNYLPSTLLALKIAKAFNTTVNEIFFLEPED